MDQKRKPVLTKLSATAIRFFLSWDLVYGFFWGGSLHIGRRPRNACVRFVARSPSVKNQSFVPSAVFH
jgi:hypothetical protein